MVSLAEYRVLRAVRELAEKEGVALTSRLAELVGGSRASLYRRLSELAKAGYIERVGYGAYRLTEEGLRVLREVEA